MNAPEIPIDVSEYDVRGVCPGDDRIIAVGGEIKNAPGFVGDGVGRLSTPLGDLSEPDVFRRFVRRVDDFLGRWGQPDAVACDLHPTYFSTRHAAGMGLPVIGVQHHHAHVASLLAEWHECGPIVGVACDGTGFGSDGAVWGCEVLLCERGEMRRLAHIDYFPLIGGDRAASETWRPAAALLHASVGEAWAARFGRLFETVPSEPLRFFERELREARGVRCSSLGRVFDATAFLLGLCAANDVQGRAPAAIESAVRERGAEPFSFIVQRDTGHIRMSLAPAMCEIAESALAGQPVERIASRFHETVAHMLCDAADQACRMRGVSTVGLTGGCFANRRLLGRCVELLAHHGRRVLTHRLVSCGDAGLALGQAFAAAWRRHDSQQRAAEQRREPACV